jgi:hypothetical protein
MAAAIEGLEPERLGPPGDSEDVGGTPFPSSGSIIRLIFSVLLPLR